MIENETHEVPMEEPDVLGKHYMFGRDCECKPEVFTRWHMGALVGVTVRHKLYSEEQLATYALTRGWV